MALMVTMIISLTIACGDEEEEVSDTTDFEATPTLVEEPTPTVEPTASSMSSTPAPTVEPTGTPAPHFVDPAPVDFANAAEIYEALPQLPNNEKYRIEWLNGIFSVEVVAQPADDLEYQQIVEEALQWFVDNGVNPCVTPLAAAIQFVGNQPVRETPPPYEVWEPSDFCIDH